MKTIRIVLGLFALLFLGGCYSVEQANTERGYRWIRRGEFDRAYATFGASLNKYPESVLGYTGRADALFEARRDQEAVADYSRAIDLYSVNRPKFKVIGGGPAEIIGKRFLSFQNQGLLFPFGLEAYIHLRRGGCYGELAFERNSFDSGLYSKALSDYDRALILAPDYLQARNARDELINKLMQWQANK